MLNANQPQPLDMTSFETRLSSDSDGPFNWTVGYFTSTRDAELDSNILAVAPDGYPFDPPMLFFQRDDETSLEQQSLFGEVNYDISQQLTLTLGARVFDSEFKKTDTTRVDLFGVQIENPVPVVSEFDESGEIFKAHLGYDLNDDVLIYGQVSEGFRPGGANQTVVGQPIPQGFESDSVVNYELGVRSSWLDGMLTLNGAVYHLVWDNIQVTERSPDNLFGYLNNAGEAQVDGIELELSWLPTANLEVAATLNAVDARLTERQPALNNDRAGLKGDDIPVVPDVTASLGVQYTWPLRDGMALFARGDVNYTGSSNNTFRDFLIDPNPDSPTFGQETDTPNDRYAEMDAYAVTNLRLGLEADSWGVDLYINNLSDKRGETYHFVDNFRPAPGETYVIRPRTAGLSVYKTF
nr:TonB-dependent receptor [Kineobactrum salinum]